MWAVFCASKAYQRPLGDLWDFSFSSLMGRSRLPRTHRSNCVCRFQSTTYRDTSATAHTNQIAMGQRVL